jgi:electron transfer flavoprotein beta subunit
VSGFGFDDIAEADSVFWRHRGCRSQKEVSVKILVTAKRVTDPDAKIRLKADLSGIETEGLEFKVNPFCENAIEAALKLVEDQGGEVVVVSIGPDEATQYIRTGLAMGGHRGIRVDIVDEKLDSDLTARVFAAVFEREKPDLFLFGKQAVDGDSGQVTQLVAEYLGLPQASFASEIKVDGGKLAVTQEHDGGLQTTSVLLPAIVSADLRLNEPRFASLPGIMKARRKKIDVLSLADLGVEETRKVDTVAYENPPQRKAGVRVASVEELMDKLVNEAKAL